MKQSRHDLRTLKAIAAEIFTFLMIGAAFILVPVRGQLAEPSMKHTFSLVSESGVSRELVEVALRSASMSHFGSRSGSGERF